MANKILLVLLLLVSTPTLASGSDTFPGIENLMDKTEYEAAGLSKLTPEERVSLNKWLVRYTAFEAPKIRSKNKEVQQAEAQFKLTARIEKPFEGWSGKTIFHLDNGESWVQRQNGHFYYSGDDTSVTISKNFLGFHIMTLTATGNKIGVKPLE